MSDPGERIAREAEKLVGAPFRLQGRDPATGLDCIGLVALALARARGIEHVDTPQAYRLRNCASDRYLVFAKRAGLEQADGSICPGDVLHTSPGPAQDHLLIAINSRCFVHAHAGLRRVVRTDAALTVPVLHHWRAALK